MENLFLSSEINNFIANNWWTLLVFLWWITSFIAWFIQFFEKQKQEVEIEKLKTQLELQKNQKLLNDKKFREWYENFTNIFIKILKNTVSKEEIDNSVYLERLYDFIETSLLFAWPNTIKSFWDYKKYANLWSNNNWEILLYIWRLFLNMRLDLWVDNKWIDENDILQTISNFDIKDLKK